MTEARTTGRCELSQDFSDGQSDEDYVCYSNTKSVRLLHLWLVAPLKPKFDRMLDFEFLLMCKKSDWKFLSKKFICLKILTMLMEVIFL